MKIDKQIKRSIIFIYLISILFKIYGAKVKVSNSIYSIDFSLWEESMNSIKEKNFYPIISPEDSINEFKNQKFIFIISNGKEKLSCDITTTVLENVIEEAQDGVFIQTNDNEIDIVYRRRDDAIFLYKFDFLNSSVTTFFLGYLSNIYETLYQYDSESFTISLDFIFDYFYNNTISSAIKINSIYNSNTYCDYQKNYDFYSNIRLNSGTIKITNFCDYKPYLKNVPKNIKDATSLISKSLIIKNVDYKSKSYLSEANLKYIPQNMNFFSDAPWCPILPYKEEEILIESENERIEGLFIGNGYYREDKKYLYLNNSRAKEIEIEFIESGMKQIVFLEDSGYLQFVPLCNVNSRKLKIKLLSIYEGDKYSDLCINCIIPVRRWQSFYEFENKNIGR